MRLTTVNSAGFEFTPEDIDSLSILHLGGLITATNNKGDNMIAAIGKVGHKILEHLYTGKKWIGTQSKVASELAAKKGYVKTSKAITGLSQKGNLGIKWGVEKAKKYPRTASAIGGAALWDILDKD